MSPRLALIGYGEVGQILHTDLVAASFDDIVVHDRQFADAASPPALAARAVGARTADSIAAACVHRDLMISAVTASEALNVARAAAPHLDGAFLLDLNSVSPQTRRVEADAVAAGQGRYVEGAVMAPIGPKRLKTSILLGGAHAAALAPELSQLGFDAQAFSVEIGRASAVKLSRSIFVKGLEAIVTESLLSARHYGVEAEVLASLGNTIPHPDWPKLARYLMSRPLVHGQRRSEEMAEAVRMLLSAGLNAPMTCAMVELHERQGALGLTAAAESETSLQDLLDAVSGRISPPPSRQAS